jgi:hypothetical protein
MSTVFTTVKMATVAPMPSASVRITTAEKPGRRASPFAAALVSRNHIIVHLSFEVPVVRSSCHRSPGARRTTSPTPWSVARATPLRPFRLRARSAAEAKSRVACSPKEARNPRGRRRSAQR